MPWGTRVWNAVAYPNPPLAKAGVARKVLFWMATGWLLSGAIALIATAWNPFPAGPVSYDWASGVFGLFWIPLAFATARYAHRIPIRTTAIAEAEARLRTRVAARALCSSDPALATALGIGRPDIPREVDDGGLVDVNHVSASTLVTSLGLDRKFADSIVAGREVAGSFSSLGDLLTYVKVAPIELDDVAGRMLFRTVV